MKNARTVNTFFMNIVIVCFGTPDVSGDSLGPEIGTLLVEKYNVSAYVYGTVGNPVTAKTMSAFIAHVNAVHKESIVLAVDASLSTADKKFRFSFSDDGVCPAAAVGRKKRFGDVGMLGVVGEKGKDNIHELIKSDRFMVQKLADKMAFVIKRAVDDLQ